MGLLTKKMRACDALILGSPVYFGNVTGRLKVFINRTRWLYMWENPPAGKVGAVVTHAGLRNGAQEVTQVILERFLVSHGFWLVEAREPSRPIFKAGVMGTLFEVVAQERTVARRPMTFWGRRVWRAIPAQPR